MLYLRSFNRFILLSLALLGLSVSSVNASIIKSFDLSGFNGFGNNTSLFDDLIMTISFEDDVNFNLVTLSKINDMTYSYSGLEVTKQITHQNGVSSFFSEAGGIVSLKIGGQCAINQYFGGYGFQLGQCGNTHIWLSSTVAPNGIGASEHGSDYYTVSEISAVPVPAAVWLFGTALIGLVGFGKRKARITA